MSTRHMITRRSFLRYGTATVGSIAFAGVFGPVAKAVPSLPHPHLFSPERQETLRALVEALSTVLPSVDAARADEVIRQVGGRYIVEPHDLVQNIDDALDAVERDAPNGSFKELSPRGRIESLRLGVRGLARRERAISDEQLGRHMVLVQSAIGLAAQPFFRDPQAPWTFERFSTV